MISTYENLSSSHPRVLKTSLDNLKLSYFDRYYEGGYTLRFYNAFSNIRDYKFKSHTDFFLTRDDNISQFIESESSEIKSTSILTSLNFRNRFLQFRTANRRNLALSGIYVDYDQYGSYGFLTNENEDTQFLIELKDDNICRISHYKEYKRYYLSLVGGVLNFYTENLNIGEIEFRYIYSKSKNAIFIFHNNGGSTSLIRRSGNSLVLAPITQNNKTTVLVNPILLSKGLYLKYDPTEGYTSVKYDDSNNIPNDGINRNTINNFIIHRTNDYSDVIVLKNQLTQNDIFTNGNNLLSSSTIPFFNEKMRNYTSISNDIDALRDESLSLNYIFYNKSYNIKPGENFIKSPDDMSPFTRLNINDSKFINCGSFAFPIPQYADKIYRLDTDTSYNDGQVYLCTWLSGSPLGGNKVWVDRYYYPDSINKQNTLNARNTFNPTYEDVVENLVKSNTAIQDSISSFNIFDKKSDMVFEPNLEYVYDRISNKTLDIPFTETTRCGIDGINYFKRINDKGEFTITFYFDGDTSNWKILSKRNNINGGLEITKNNREVFFNFNLFNSSNSSFTTFNAAEEIKIFKRNFAAVSINSKTGAGYFCMNGAIIKTFNFPQYQFFNKRIIFGDFDYDKNSTIEEFKIYENYTEPEFSVILPILEGKEKIDDLTITLPCGFRNGEDSVELLQSVCSNQTFKSNKINLNIKNLNIEENDKKGVEKFIKEVIKKEAPITSELNKINFV